MDLEALLTVHGPLGLGWILFIIGQKRSWTLQDKMITIVENNTRFMTLLEERSRLRSKIGVREKIKTEDRDDEIL